MIKANIIVVFAIYIPCLCLILLLYKYGFVIILGGVELLSSILSPFVGLLSDITGRRRIILLGYIGPLAYFMISILGIKYIIPLIFLAGIGESIVLTSSAGTVLDRGRSSGVYYAVYSAGMPIGWGVSGILFSLLPLDLTLVYRILALIESIAVTIFYMSFPDGGIMPIKFKMIVEAFKESKMPIIYISLTVILLSSSIEAFWNGFYFKLIDIISDNQLLFGLLYSTFPAILGFIGRFITGHLVDRYNPWYILLIIPFTLISISLGMYFLNGPIIILFWLIPIYAFYELSTTISVSRVLPGESQASGAGIVTLARSLGGLIIMGIGIAYLLDLSKVLLSIVILCIIAQMIILKIPRE